MTTPHVSDLLEAELLDFEAARAKRQASAPDLDPEPEPEPVTEGARGLARRYISAHARHAQGVTLRRWQGRWYRWTAETGCYRQLTEERVDVDLYSALPIGKRSEVAEVRLALMAEPGVLIDEHNLSEWIDGPPPDGFGTLDTVAFRNGLVHLPTGRVLPASPRYFTTAALPHAYDPVAPTPKRWLSFLRQIWPHDEDSIAFLQEWMGYLLTPDTRQHKIAWLIGAPRSGKGTIGRVIETMLGGDANCASPTLGQFGSEFGLQSLIGKLVAIVGDARLSGRMDAGPIVERLLGISGADAQSVNRKNRDFWYGALSSRIMILSNEVPMLADASPALATRSIILTLRESFLGREDMTLSQSLTAEMPGIICWAIEGWRRLQARGRFEAPADSDHETRLMADLASPVGAWIRDRCVAGEPDPDRWITCDDAYASFKAWCAENGQQHVPTQMRFGRDVKTVSGCCRVRPPQKFPGAPRPGYYSSLRLKTAEESETE